MEEQKLNVEEFLSQYRTQLEKVDDQEELDRWDRLVNDFPATVEAFGEENALEWLAIAFTGGKSG